MFNKNFYPTSRPTIEMMTAGLEISGKIIMDPQGGKGDIVDYLQEQGAKKVLSCEIHPDLRMILERKCTIVENNFFNVTPEQVSHLDAIVMNPPFDLAAKHIIHAFEVAPEGCEIRAICNWETIENDWSGTHKELKHLIKNYGTPPTKHDEEFKSAQRKTNVDIAFFTLLKPVVSEDADYSGFFMDEEEDTSEGEGLLPYNEVRSIVQRYIGTVKAFDSAMEKAKILDSFTDPIGFGSGFKFHLTYSNSVTSREDFIKELQKKSWKWIIEKMNIRKFVTSKVMEDINKFVETQEKYPFTMKNIYKMIEIIIGTRENTMNRSLVEVFDKLTKHYHENRYNVEGWKTNSHYLVNKKFIIDHCVERRDGGGFSCKYDTYSTRQLNDLQKALSFLMGDGVEVQEFYQWGYNRESDGGTGEYRKTNTWYEWGYLEVKGFKKGTLHCKFISNDVWEKFNRKVAEIKGYPLPEKV